MVALRNILMIPFASFIVMAKFSVERSSSGRTAEQCQYPPFMWCDNPEIQKRCGVIESCGKYEIAVTDKPVKLTFLYEVLCQACRVYIKNVLYPTWMNLKGILRLDLVPFGNANITTQGDQWQMYCQHGQLECILNMLQACVIKKLKSQPELYMPLVVCIDNEVDIGHDPFTALDTCFSELKVPEKYRRDILKCQKSWEGAMLMNQMADKTLAAWPVKHRGVPWLLINGAGTVQSQGLVDNLGSIVCDQVFRGSKPDSCKLYEKFRFGC